jgi:hypothetical protein
VFAAGAVLLAVAGLSCRCTLQLIQCRRLLLSQV